MPEWLFYCMECRVLVSFVVVKVEIDNQQVKPDVPLPVSNSATLITKISESPRDTVFTLARSFDTSDQHKPVTVACTHGRGERGAFSQNQ